MFYCDPCAEARKWPIGISKSVGTCEICGKGRVPCSDRPSRYLPEPLKVVEDPQERTYEILDVLRFNAKIGRKAGKLYGGDGPDAQARRAVWAGCKVKFPGIADDIELHPFLESVYASAYRQASKTSGTPKRPVEIEEADRPDTKAGEDATLSSAFHAALTECCDILELPGSPNLCDIPKVLRRLKAEGKLRP